jgi:hypothetical protein
MFNISNPNGVDRLMWSFIRGEPSTIICLGAPLMIGGLMMAVICAHLEIPGLLTAVYAVMLGASAGCLIDWQTERGLWMFAALFIVFLCVVYGMIVAGQLCDVFRQVRQPGVGLLIDAAVAMMLLSTMIRFLAKVARYNWIISHSRDDV